MSSRAASAYKRVDLESAPKHQILDRLFDRFAADVSAARAAIQARDVKAKALEIDHAIQLVTELRASLDHASAPELCANLDALYEFVISRLVDANLRIESQPLEQASRIMAELGDAFRRAHQK
jgi:flagellar protein FliS